MDISLVSVGELFVRSILLLAGAGILALFIMWPINDQPVSKTQKAVWFVSVIIAFLFTFGFVRFV